MAIFYTVVRNYANEKSRYLVEVIINNIDGDSLLFGKFPNRRAGSGPSTFKIVYFYFKFQNFKSNSIDIFAEFIKI